MMEEIETATATVPKSSGRSNHASAICAPKLMTDDATRVAYLAAHPWLWRLGWLPWQLSAFMDLLTGVALWRTAWIPRRPAAIVLVVTILALFPDQGGQALWVTRGLDLAVTPVGLAPVLLVDEREGRTSRLPRALCRVQAADDIGSTIKRALDSNAPALVEVPITRDASIAAAEVVGWWDFPVLPTATDAVKADYKAGYAAEQHRSPASDVELAEPVSAVG